MHQCEKFDINCKECVDEACEIASVFDYESAPSESQWSDEQKQMIKEILSRKPSRTPPLFNGPEVYSIMPMPYNPDMDVFSIISIDVDAYSLNNKLEEQNG